MTLQRALEPCGTKKKGVGIAAPKCWRSRCPSIRLEAVAHLPTVSVGAGPNRTLLVAQAVMGGDGTLRHDRRNAGCVLQSKLPPLPLAHLGRLLLIALQLIAPTLPPDVAGRQVDWPFVDHNLPQT